ncbi:MAG: crossover junction endodeoxyribonuclease RuvC [Thermoguttaceae bacterium]
MRILGIDPGLNTTGYGIIESTGNRVRLVEGGIVRSRGKTLAEKVREIYEGVREVVVEFSPDTVALEELFAHYDRPSSAILMGHARGVICLAIAQSNLPVTAYPPAKIKKVLTGSGKATKDQMQRAIALELGLAAPPEPPDVADALALAICHRHLARLQLDQ